MFKALAKFVDRIPDRFKNPWFIMSLVSIVLTAAGISAEAVTSWDILFDGLANLLNNPYALSTTIMSIIGIFVDPSTPGLLDDKEKQALIKQSKHK